MIRKKSKIDFDIKVGKANLGVAINDSIRAEESSEKYIASINKRLSELASEICFEDTLEGRIKALEDTAFGKIDEILKELSEVTGKDYQLMDRDYRKKLKHFYNYCSDDSIDALSHTMNRATFPLDRGRL